MINRVARIKISFYILMVFVFSFLIQLVPVQNVFASDIVYRYHHVQGSNIVFDEQGQVFTFIARAKTAASISHVRFGTIGWQVRFEPQDGSQKFYTRITRNNVRTIVQHDDGNTYAEYVIPITQSSNQQFSPSIVEALVRDFGKDGYDSEYFIKKLANGVTIKFDAVVSIRESGTTATNALMDEEGNIIHGNPNVSEWKKGEHYLTKDGTTYVTNHKVRDGWETRSEWDIYFGGAKGARGWSDLSVFDDYFDKETQYVKEDVIVKRPIYATHRTTDGKRLDPGGKNRTVGTFDVKIGQTRNINVTGLSFPGYKIAYSSINYNGTNQETVHGSQAITRTVKFNATNDTHLVSFYYEPIVPETSLPDGKITFTPHQSLDIQGNRDGWVNNNISVKVTVNPSSVTMHGSENRTYRYYDPCHSVDDNNNCVAQWVDDSINVPYTQTWKAEELTVTGQGKNANGDKVNIGPFKISNGGTITLDKELKDVQLSARVSSWKAQNDKTFASDPPPLGSWTKTHPSNNTPAPNKDYASNSGNYYLDKTAPKITSVSPQSAKWTNQTVNVTVDVSDNLSGLYWENSYVEAIDSSHYGHSEAKSHFSSGATTGNKTISLTKEGIYQIKVNLEDIAQNKMTEATYGYYRIDKTRPDAAKFTSDTREYIDEDLTVTVTIGDNLSGVAETRYVLSNSPNDKTGMKSISLTTAEGKAATNTFTVDITEPGSWWIHVYQKDRAGNVTETTSQEYRIIRLGDPENNDGDPFDNMESVFWISPTQTKGKIPRGARFDVLLKTHGLTEQDATITKVHMKAPKWVNDSVWRKVNGKYAVSSGTTMTMMNYYSGYAEDTLSYAKPTTALQWWKAFIPPYGTQITLDAKGNRLRPKYQLSVQLEFEGYSPSKTHVSTIEFDVVPETKLKTEIIKNEY